VEESFRMTEDRDEWRKYVPLNATMKSA